METLRVRALEAASKLKKTQSSIKNPPLAGVIRLFEDNGAEYGSHLCPSCVNLVVDVGRTPKIMCPYPDNTPFNIGEQIVEGYQPHQIQCHGYRRPESDEVLKRFGDVFRYVLRQPDPDQSDVMQPDIQVEVPPEPATRLPGHLTERLISLTEDRLYISQNRQAVELISRLSSVVAGEGAPVNNPRSRNKHPDSSLRVQFFLDRRMVTKDDREISINSEQLGITSAFTVQLRNPQVVDQRLSFLPVCEMKILEHDQLLHVRWSLFDRWGNPSELTTYQPRPNERVIIDQLRQWFETR